MTVKEVIIQYGLPAQITLIGNYSAHWKDDMDKEALAWSYYEEEDVLEIEIE